MKDVLCATLAELARVGYVALRIEDVAARANVHKTTIYRRWPTKAELTQDMLLSLFEESFTLPDTGTLRGDLVAFAQSSIRFFSSEAGRCLARLLIVDADPELRRVIILIRERKQSLPRQIFAHAVERDEIAADVDGQLLVTTLVGAVHHQVAILGNADFDPQPLVDLLLNGVASSTTASPRASAVRIKSKAR